MATAISTPSSSGPSAAPATATGARLLCEALVREGVDTIFGYPGGAVLPIYDELTKMERELRHILVRHEQGAVHMAEGYARSTGKCGVALVTSGPGATNAITGIANAMMDSTPLVVISGQVPRALLGSDAFQETDMIGLTRSCTKESFAVMSAADIAVTVREAFHIATTGRPGPVVIDLPKDVCQEQGPWVFPRTVHLPGYRPPVFRDQEGLRKAAELLVNAQRPVVYLGGGVVHSGAAAELAAVIERLHLPATPTLMGLGAVPAGHPLCLGMLGMHGAYAANKAVSESDLLFAVGARFDDRVTGKLSAFAPHATIVHIDIDSSSFHKNVRADLTLLGDVRTVLAELLPLLPTPSKAEPVERRLAPWWDQIRAWQAFAPFRYEDHSEEIKPQRLCQEFNRLTKGEAIVATDVGQHQMWLAQYYQFRDGRQSITSGGLGTMGFGMPAALGAQIAFPDRQVVAFVGDGGFQMTCQELTTAVAYQTNLKIIIMNNRSLGMVRQWQKLFYDKRFIAVDLTQAPDFVKLAEAYGATGLRATHASELVPVLEKGLATPGVVVMEIVVTTDESVFPMIPAGGAAADMVLG